MFTTIDRHALSIAERIAHFAQRNFGIKPISIALAGYILFACTFTSRWFIPGVTVSTANKFVDVALSISFFWVTVVFYPILEKEIEEDASKGLSNKHKIFLTARTARLLALIMSVICLIELFSGASLENLNFFLQGFGALVAMYFIACDPLPPGPSRLRKLLERLTSRTSVVRN